TPDKVDFVIKDGKGYLIYSGPQGTRSGVPIELTELRREYRRYRSEAALALILEKEGLRPQGEYARVAARLEARDIFEQGWRRFLPGWVLPEWKLEQMSKNFDRDVARGIKKLDEKTDEYLVDKNPKVNDDAVRKGEGDYWRHKFEQEDKLRREAEKAE